MSQSVKGDTLQPVNFFVVVPTLNAAKDWPRLTTPLLGCVPADRVLILDSSSSDETATLVTAAGFRLHRIPRSDFNHGGTRQLVLKLLPDAEVLVFLTQDVEVMGPDAVTCLLRAFVDPMVAAAYGR